MAPYLTERSSEGTTLLAFYHNQLREAATLGDFHLLISLAARVETRNARLGAALRALAGKFDMQRILDLLGKE